MNFLKIHTQVKLEKKYLFTTILLTLGLGFFLLFPISTQGSFHDTFDNESFHTPLKLASVHSGACSDQVDNDFDGTRDFDPPPPFIPDPGCDSPSDDDETNPPQCSDGQDNDGDNLVDLADPGCENNPNDNDESNAPLPFCGDGNVDPGQGEQCDEGPANGFCSTPGVTCSTSSCAVCPLPAICGANGCEPSESCFSCPQDCGECPPPTPAPCIGGSGLENLWPIVPDCPKYEWPELVLVAQRLMNFLIALSIPLAAVGFAIAGFIYITAAGSEEKIKKAHSVFWKIGLGFLLVLTAWLIVYVITSPLLDQYQLLQE